MSLACHCYSCNVDYPEFIYPSSDTQNLILQICKGIFEAIQNENTSAEIICSILHEWSESRYNDSLIKYLLKISKEWYDPFTRYLQHIDRQKRNEWLSDKDTNIKEDELKQLLLDNLADYLPGFKYLFEYSWDSYDDNNNLHKGDFIIASDSGAFHHASRINHNKLTHPSQQEESPSILNTGTITITAAAAVVVGYLICRTFSRRDD
ncbi:unnamed protein product [Rhizophagus irregularis]|nr:unnamed protein product [Rhizophagus irregularis]